LLTDVVLPTMQGTEIADAVEAQRPAAVVVYPSGYAREAFGERGLRPSAFLEKPLCDKELLDALGRHGPG
jgi:FixJ family two-component response regulator